VWTLTSMGLVIERCRIEKFYVIEPRLLRSRARDWMPGFESVASVVIFGGSVASRPEAERFDSSVTFDRRLDLRARALGTLTYIE